MTTAAILNNRKLKIVHVDDKGKRDDYVIVTFLDELPKPAFDLSKTIVITPPGSEIVCQPCTYKGNALIYNFSKNETSYRNGSNAKYKLNKGLPVVGKPYSFSVVNINPFRDSVIVSHATADYNTEVPGLFNQAFFSAGKTTGVDSLVPFLLADVFALGQQINAIITALKNTRECDDICNIIQQTKNETEKYFRPKYSFDPKKALVTNIADYLQNINDVYKDSVSAILKDYLAFYSVKNYFNYNIPQIQNVDEYIFTLSVLPKAGAQLNTIVDHQPISVRTLGGFKFDFSSGLFVTGLRDQRFTLRPDSTVISNSFGGDSIVYNRRNEIIPQSDDKKVDFGVAALMHFYPRLSTWGNVGISLGAGLSIGPDPAIRYLGGASLLLGRSGRFILTYGCAAGYVDVLADGYQNLQFTSLGDKKAMTKKSFKTRGFWGLTFNIPLFKSKVNTAEAKPEEKKEEEEPKEEPAKEEEKK